MWSCTGRASSNLHTCGAQACISVQVEQAPNLHTCGAQACGAVQVEQAPNLHTCGAQACISVQVEQALIYTHVEHKHVELYR